ncbi:MAG TPA: chromate transporter [Clostridiales bacterium]|nr:chromate transporter [Clostridiales bacterium]
MKELWDLFVSFLKVGSLMFGGGLSMLPLLIREIVTKKKWVTEDELLDYYAIVQCTPGIIAVNTATFIGYKRKGIPGGIIAALGAVLPSLLIILLIASALSGLMDNHYVLYALGGIRAAVCALLVNTIINMAKKSILDGYTMIIALVTIGTLFFLPVPLLVVIIASGFAGVILFKVKQGVKP